jgi:two-component system, NarL family, response regulator DevR
VREPCPSVIKVAAIDESELVLHGLRAVLRPETGIELVLTATALDEVADELRRLGVHGVVFAAGASRRDTIARCEELRAALGPQPFLCVLSPTPDEQLLLDVTHAGVRGFLVRDIPASTIASAIRFLAEGECFVDPGLAAMLFDLVRAEPDHALEQLSSTERAILSRLGEGLSNAEIAQQVFLSEKTVRNYISRLLRKLDLSCRADAVALASRGARRGLDDRLVVLR